MSNRRFSAIMDFATADRRNAVAEDSPVMPRVLVVDDDPGMQLLMNETLADAGFEVAVASSGAEGISACARFEPHLVLLDINMPGMDGITACIEIRKQSERYFPIIMVTSVDDASAIHQAFDAGATDFILKPVNWPIFQRRLESVLGEWNKTVALDESNKRVDLLEKVAPEQAMLVSRSGQIVEDLKKHRTARDQEADQPCVTLDDIYGTDTASRFKQRISGVLKTGRDNRLEFTVEERNVIRNFEAAFLAHGRDSVLVVVQIMSNDTDKTSEVYELAFYDVSTNLPNRHLFNKTAAEVLADAGLHEKSLVLLSLCFEGVYGEDLQDHDLMQSAVKRLNDCLLECPGLVTFGRKGNGAQVAQFGANRFMIIVEDIQAESDVRSLCDQIDRVFKDCVDYENGSLVLSPHFGAATFPVDGNDLQTIEHAAQSAMDEAVLTGEIVCFASQAAIAYEIETGDSGDELRQAMANDQLELYFQPRISLPGDAITCFEALLRWNHPMRGFVGLQELLPLAKSTGLIVKLGDWVLRAACREAQSWEGNPPPRVSVNLSQQEFSSQDFADRVMKIIVTSGMDAERIELEFTEAALLRTKNELADLKTLNDLGIGLVLDNFGTGHSSLTLLSRYPIDAMKIDGAFVRNLPGDKKDSAVCDVIITMAHKLGMKAVAENVETEEQLNLLFDMGCDEFQGYHICEPLPAREVELYLRRRSKKNR